jgi:hypothetical protein
MCAWYGELLFQFAIPCPRSVFQGFRSLVHKLHRKAGHSSLLDEAAVFSFVKGARERGRLLPGTDAPSIAMTVWQTGGGGGVISGASLLGGPAEIRLLARVGSPVTLVC